MASASEDVYATSSKQGELISLSDEWVAKRWLADYANDLSS